MVLGDNPEYLMNTVGNSMLNLMGGTSDPMVLGVVLFCCMAFIALAGRLDRGGLVFLGVIFMGIMVYFAALPNWTWWAMLVCGIVLATYGVLNMLRQGEG